MLYLIAPLFRTNSEHYPKMEFKHIEDDGIVTAGIIDEKEMACD